MGKVVPAVMKALALSGVGMVALAAATAWKGSGIRSKAWAAFH